MTKERKSWCGIGKVNDRKRNTKTITDAILYYEHLSVDRCTRFFSSSYRLMSSSSSSNISLSSEKLGNNENDVHDSNEKKLIIKTTEKFLHTSSNRNRKDFSTSDDDQKKDNNYHIVTVTANVTEGKQKQSFRSMVRQFGPVFIGTYGVAYVSTVFGLFMGVQSGLLDATYIMSYLTGNSSTAAAGAAGDGIIDPDTIQYATSTMNEMVEFLGKYSWTKPLAPIVEQYPWTANFAIAWIMTKFTEPIRMGFTVMITPYTAKKLGYGPTAQNSSPSLDVNTQPPTNDDNESISSSSPTKIDDVSSSSTIRSKDKEK